MKALLDTHVFLWWISDNRQLSADARAFIKNGANTLLLSAASAWEIAIKAQTGRLALPDSPARFVPREMAANGIEGLPISLNHALGVGDLPPLHRDPFDRLLVIQAQYEGLPILTADPLIVRYDVQTIW